MDNLEGLTFIYKSWFQVDTLLENWCFSFDPESSSEKNTLGPKRKERRPVFQASIFAGEILAKLWGCLFHISLEQKFWTILLGG